MAPIAVGSTIPDGTLTYFDADDELAEVSVHSLAAGKKVIILGVPGAFTPTCRWNPLKVLSPFFILISFGGGVLVVVFDFLLFWTIRVWLSDYLVMMWSNCRKNWSLVDRSWSSDCFCPCFFFFQFKIAFFLKYSCDGMSMVNLFDAHFCSMQHVAGFIERAGEISSKGVAEILLISGIRTSFFSSIIDLYPIPIWRVLCGHWRFLNVCADSVEK